MKRFINVLLIALCTISACTKSNVYLELQKASPKPRLVSIMELAESIPVVSSSSGATKAESVIVKSLEPAISLYDNNKNLKSIKLTESGRKALNQIYIVNYGNADGYAIISSDYRLPAVLQYIPKGELDIDTELSIGHEVTLSAIAQLANSLGESDDSLPEILNNEPSDIPMYYEYVYEDIPSMNYFSNVVGPYINFQWDQGAPFNNDADYAGCQTTSNGKYPIGCVPLALAQIMTYHEYPEGEIVEGIEPAWSIYKNCQYPSSFPSSVRSSIAALCYALAIQTHTDFSCYASIATTGDTEATLGLYGYSFNVTSNYNDSGAEASLNSGYPICMFASNAYTHLGHCWVAAGYRKQHTFRNKWVNAYDSLDNLMYSQYLGIDSITTLDLYNLFGMEDITNGYASTTIFDDQLTENVKMITNIHPR